MNCFFFILVFIKTLLLSDYVWFFSSFKFFSFFVIFLCEASKLFNLLSLSFKLIIKTIIFITKFFCASYEIDKKLDVSLCEAMQLRCV